MTTSTVLPRTGLAFAVPDDVVLVADGGLATELEARGNDLADSLWSARLLMDAPDQVDLARAARAEVAGDGADNCDRWARDPRLAELQHRGRAHLRRAVAVGGVRSRS
jgi:S-methylmethionine-dependent homocysteine/selenocysteine methylase